jgi:hypothetical protein
MPIPFIQVERITAAPYALYIKLHSVSYSYMAEQVLLDGLVYAASDKSSSLFTLNLPCAMCVGGMNACVSPRL